MNKNKVKTASDFFSYVKTLERVGSFREGSRLGQLYFNSLKDFKPTLADRIRASEIDPFYSDSLIPRFKLYVLENWDTYK